ncbi:response regulator transcription factor [Streptomyces sp. SJ1-7]|nr:response regulator transcription factor [Streptomyces sp. SJ1-7]
MTSVLVCDDSPLAREALRRAVATVPGVERVTTAANGEEVLRRWGADRSDLILMDVRMPGLGVWRRSGGCSPPTPGPGSSC